MNSKCCNAPIIETGIGDFHDSDMVITQYWICTACEHPADPMGASISRLEKYINKVKKMFEGDHVTQLFLTKKQMEKVQGIVLLLPEHEYVNIPNNIHNSEYPFLTITASGRSYHYTNIQNTKFGTYHTFTRDTSEAKVAIFKKNM